MSLADGLARCRAWCFVQVLRARSGPGRQALAALAGTLLGALAMWAASVPDLQDALASADRRRQQLQVQAEALRARQALPPESTTVLAAGTAPQVGAQPWQWPQMAQTAQTLGLHIEQWQAAPAVGAEGRWQLRLRGRYPQHAAWVALLAGDPAAPALLSYQLQEAEAGLLRAEVLLQPWDAIPEALEPSSAATGHRASAQRDPFGAPPASDAPATLPAGRGAEFQRPPRWLEAAPLQDLEFTGTLRQGEAWVALLRRERMLHTVRVGDTLGLQRLRVQGIAEHGLWLREIVRAEDGRWQERERLWRVGERP